MKYFIKIVSLTGLFTISQLAYSAPISDTYTTGDTLTATTLDNIKSAVNDNDTRITSLEAPGPDFSGFGTGFSGDGAPKNVRIMSQPNGGGGTNYILSILFESSTEMVSIDGGSIQRPFFGVFPFVQTDNVGNVIGVSNLIETPDTVDYITYNIEQSSYDPSFVKTVTDDTLRESYVCNGGRLQFCLATDTLTDGTFQDNYTRTMVRSLSGPFTVNGMTFNEVRVENQLGNDRLRIRAKGIGEVFRSQPSQNDRELIYYRANGTTGGSLAGTPFAAGGELENFFFIP